MVHKKYSYRGGKKYGPYLYENKRVGEKVVTNYMGKDYGRNNFLVYSLLFLLFLAIIAIVILASNISPTGRVSSSLENVVYKPGEYLAGMVKFNVRAGELIPSGSQIIVTNGDQQKIIPLSDLLIKPDSADGNYYAENSNLAGNGEGYGLIGKKKIYPSVDFQLLVYSSIDDVGEQPEESISDQDNGTVSSGSGSSGGSEEPIIDQISEQPEEGVVEIPVEQQTGEIVEQPSEVEPEKESSGSDSFSITGNAVIENAYIIDGKVAKGNDYDYTLEQGQKAEIVKGSVKFNESNLSDNVLDLRVSGEDVRVSTDYYYWEEGFGEEYLGDYDGLLQLDLASTGIKADSPDLKIEIVYNGQSILSTERNLNIIDENGTIISESSVNLSLIKEIPTVRVPKNGTASIDLSDYFLNSLGYSFSGNNITSEIDGSILRLTAGSDFKGALRARVTALNGEVSLDSNEFTILVSSGNINVQTSRSNIKLGETVKWTKNVSLDTPEEIVVELPVQAENVEVNVADVDIAPSIGGALTGFVSVDINLGKESKFVTFFKRLFAGLTGRVIDESGVESVAETKQISLSDNATEYVIEYETPAPIATETETSNGKEVVISAPDGLGYTDVLSFTNLDDSLNVGDESKIKVYWKEAREYVPFDAYDLSGDGKLDYIEWITPHLSSQTFDIIYGTSLQDGLVSLWSFEDNANDETGMNNGSWSGTTSYTTGVVGQAASFDGSSYIDMGTTESLKLEGNSFTLSLWFNTASSSAQMLMSDAQSDGYGWFFTFNRVTGACTESSIDLAKSGIVDQCSAYSFNQNQWYHLVAVQNYDSGSPSYIDYYVDGVNVGNFTHTSNFTSASGYSFRMGYNYVGGLNNFNGKIDEVAVWNRSLTTSEISSLYNNVTILSANTTAPTINFTSPTPSNGSTITVNNFNVSMASSDDYNHYAFVNFNNSLVGWWRFEGSDSYFLGDDSGNNNNGTASGTITRANGTFGQAAVFDGSSYVSMGSPSSLGITNYPLTLSAWVKVDVNNRQMGILGSTVCGYNYAWYIHQDGSGHYKPYFGKMCADEVGFNSGLNTEQWYHLAVTYDFDGLKFYLNGQPDGSSAYSSTFSVADINLGIIGSDRLDGSIDDLLVFNRSLSVSEVASLYNATTNQYMNNFSDLADGNYTIQGFAVDTSGNKNQTEVRTIGVNFTEIGGLDNYDLTTGLAGYWKLNETSGTTVYDYSGNGKNGTLNNGVTQNNSGPSATLSKAYSFDGSDDYITIPNMDVGQSMSVFSWIKRSNPAPSGYWYDTVVMSIGNDGWGLFFQTEDGSQRVGNSRIGVSADYSNNGITNTNWHYIGWTMNSSGTCYYIDGSPDGCTVYTYLPDSGGNSYTIGSRGTGQYFTGSIDEVSVWNRSLSAAEVSQLYNSSNGYNIPTNVTISGDTTPPTITINSPLAGQTYNSTTWAPNVDWNDSVSCEYSYNNISWTTMASCNNGITDPYSLFDLSGEVTLYVRGNDSSNNVGMANAAFTFSPPDTTAPALTITSPTNSTYETNTVLINFTAIDSSGISNFWFNNGTDNVSYTDPANITLANGNYQFIFYANDTLGNVNSTSVDFNVNTLLISGCRNLTEAGTYNLTQNIGSGGDCVFVNVDGVVIDGNDYNVTGNIIGGGAGLDEFGNADSGNNFNLIDIFVSGNISSNGVNCGGGNAGVGGNISVSDSVINGSVISLGSACYIGGSSGNVLIINSNITKVYANGAVSYMGQGGDGGNVTLVNSTVEFVNVSGIEGGDGGNVVFDPCPTPVPIVDVSGHMGFFNNGTNGTITPESCYDGFVAGGDTTAPNLSINSPAMGNSYGPNTWSPSVNWGDSVFCEYSYYNIDWNTVNCANNGLDIDDPGSDGEYYFYIRGNDSVGNQGTSDIIGYFTYDSVAPIVLVYSPENTTYNNASRLVNFTGSDNYLDDLWFNNGTANVTYTSPVVVNVSDGSHTFTFYANDSAGNENSTAVTFFVDSVAPTINIYSPTSTTYNNATRLVNISSDGGYVWFNNGTANVTYTSPVYVTFNEGSNTLRAWANDSAGNVGDATVTFNVDVTAPSIAVYSPTVGFYNSSLWIPNISWGDSVEGTCEYSYDNMIWTGVNCSNNGTDIPAPELYGEYMLYSRANDLNGNTGTAQSDQETAFYYSNGSEIEITFPSNGSSYILSNWIGLSYNFIEGVSGACEYSTNGADWTPIMTCGNDPFGTPSEGLNNWYLRESVGGGYDYSEVTFTYDSIAPTVSYVYDTENSYLTSNDGEVVYQTIDVAVDYLGAEDVNAYLYNSSGALVQTSHIYSPCVGEGCSPAAPTAQFVVTTPGNYTYQVNATDAAGNVNSTALRSVKVVDSCISQCAEGSNCTITQDCVLNNALCTGEVCEFNNLTVNAKIYTLYDSNGNGNNLTLNLTSTIPGSSIEFGNGNSVIFSGRNGTDLSVGSQGGNAGIVNVTVYDLFDTTGAFFIGQGGYTTASGLNGGNGGQMQLNYHGLVRGFNDCAAVYGGDNCLDAGEENLENVQSPLLGSGSAVGGDSGGVFNVLNSSSSLYNYHGSIAFPILNKNIQCLPINTFNLASLERDSDANGDGIPDGTDVDVLKGTLYNKNITDLEYDLDYDVACKNKINVVAISRIGLNYRRGA